MILRYIAALFLCCFCFTGTQAQGPELDSLVKAEQAYTKEDSVKLKLLNDIAFYQQYVDPAVGLQYAEKAIALATKMNDGSGLARAYFVMGVDYLRLDNVSKTLESLQKAANLYEAQHKPIDLARVYNTIGAAYLPHNEHYKDALVYLDKAIAIYKAQGDKQYLPSSILNKALLYKRMDSVGPAIRHFNEVLGLFRQYMPTNKQLEARIYSGLGDAYIEFSEAKLRANGITGNKYDSAVYYVQKALDVFNELGSEDGKANNHRRLGTLYLAQKNYPLALQHAKQANEIARQGGFLSMEADAITVISEVYAASGRYDSAFANLKKYVVLNDSLLNDEKERELIQNEMQYNFDKKEDSLHFQNALLSKDNTLNKLQLRQQWLYSGGALVLLLGLGGFLYYRNRNKQVKLVLQFEKERAEQKQRESEFERKVSDAALHSLRSQMNPHFIFNCLNSIKLYAVENNQEAATSYLGKFSRLMRLVLENSKSDRILLQQEVETLQLYMEMEAMRFKEKLHYKIDIADNVDMDYIEIPPMLIQPYVENAIWHGLMPKADGGTLVVSFRCEEDNLKIVVRDNGVGRARAAELKSKSATTHKSFGMSITHQRIELINQLYNTNMSVTVHDLHDGQGQATGTEVIIDIPID
ncbi:tetratricopeptide repeat protein [Paraflavitalea pollutisoli]|uniref:tetratricopeptide repeat-containing sensor histidine kinase n=1 Tax=Paraflavitalea pollutisoli TaxID=3034143 RepID=UPI0023ED547C|nr:tetratricopeptide repeat protein [Paraflavitalea sp. H1-2-19X]